MNEQTQKLQTLRKAASDAIKARDAIENCDSLEWKIAHQIAFDACMAAREYSHKLARDPATRNSDWANATDRMLMTFGYL